MRNTMRNIMTKLSININQAAALQGRYHGETPALTQIAIDCEAYGVDGISVRPGAEGSPVCPKAVFDLRAVVHTEFNVEGYPSPEFIDLVLKLRPHQVTLVPEADEPEDERGWDAQTPLEQLSEVLDEFNTAGIRTSVRVLPDTASVEFAAKAGADRVELCTTAYAARYADSPQEAVAPFVEAAQAARRLGLGLNAGHHLNLSNLHYFYTNIPWLDEVSVGHALASDTVYLGLERTIHEYKNCLHQ